MKAAKKGKDKESMLLGIGFDARDGHKRLTRGKNFVLFGGSDETHSVMQVAVVKLNEHLDRKGKRLEEVTPREIDEVLRDACE